MGRRTEKAGPQAIGPLVESLLGGLSVQRSKNRAALEAAWESAIGPAGSRHTRVMGLDRGILHVAVESAPLLQHLAHFRKTELLRALRADPAGAGIRDLRLSAGN
ncbi:MAG: DUF721 domain-containing protein [Planctomycetes bacterium]|nr:DUF721 domain-containing protein [Planctomycetota bacterium]